MRTSQPARVVLLAFVCAILILGALIGNPAVSRAEPLGSDIVCHVFTTLNELGTPIPSLDAGNCPGSPPPSPPPSPEPTPPPPPPPAFCADGIDNDEDGLIDLNDLGCADASDNDETDPVVTPPPPPPPTQCADGEDNDGDEKIDAEDPGCENARDTDEANGNEEDTSPTPPPPSPSPAPTPAPTPSPTPSSSGGGSPSTGSTGSPQAGSGSSSGGGGGGGGGLAPGTTLYTSTSTSGGVATQVLGATAFSTTTESCDRYLTAFIREGKENDADQVKRLQRFLRDFEGVRLGETGAYDTATESAVRAFQDKYAGDILTPWGIKESTGFVYLTTRKKVNEIFCGYTKVFYLTMDEQKKIDDSRASSLGTTMMQQHSGQPAKKPEKVSAVAPTTTEKAKGQSAVDRSLRFLRGFWNSAQ